MSLRLKLDQESIDAIRELAAAMPMLKENIEMSTSYLIQLYNSLENEVGPHRNELQELMLHIQSAAQQVEETLEVLPPMLEKVAEQVEGYIAYAGTRL